MEKIQEEILVGFFAKDFLETNIREGVYMSFLQTILT